MCGLSFFFHGEGCNLDTYKSAEEGINTLKDRDYDIIIAYSFFQGDGWPEIFHPH
jgi:hypothetical protein